MHCLSSKVNAFPSLCRAVLLAVPTPTSPIGCPSDPFCSRITAGFQKEFRSALPHIRGRALDPLFDNLEKVSFTLHCRRVVGTAHSCQERDTRSSFQNVLSRKIQTTMPSSGPG
ncbi:hypothetical protein CALVIDRAFT_541349 [Calocera viscosa TUFC12733]|uniref:Secreted protein n=1 Tax=Calocera viscosa (strain TUFC12733) TaxID=1330018 RepID=A0A167HUN2_CALVF|nr:hypothetical protein CALVIDRAFT_541349 [Calocera viscosa TUFC12733]